jgi:hypothetical protein
MKTFSLMCQRDLFIVQTALTDFFLKLSHKSNVICNQTDQDAALLQAIQIFAFQTRIEELLAAIDCEIDAAPFNPTIQQILN